MCSQNVNSSLQAVRKKTTSGIERMFVPDPTEEFWNGCRWGSVHEPFTPAFWKAQAFLNPPVKFETQELKNLREVIVYCLLGGYGFKAELGWGYFEKLVSLGFIEDSSRFSESDLERVLRTPIHLGDNRLQRYRFPKTKARYIWEAMRFLDAEEAPSNLVEIRPWLLKIKGIGLKTASWILRNHYGANDVAILDIHILRAGYRGGFLKKSEVRSDKDYYELENQFLSFCSEIEEDPARLDLLMWYITRSILSLPQTSPKDTQLKLWEEAVAV